MPNLLIFLTFSKFVTLWPWPWDENEKSSSVGLCRCHWANQIPKPLPNSTNPSEKIIFYVKIHNFLSSWPCDLDLGTKLKSWAPWGYAGAIRLTKYRNPSDSTNPLGEDANWNRLPPTFFGRGSAHNGRTMPILRKTQRDHDINLPPKLYQDHIKTHRAMLGTDRQTPITNRVVTYFLWTKRSCSSRCCR